MAILKIISAAIATLALATNTAAAGQLHVYTSGAAGFNTHSVWYDDGKEVTVVDTQFMPVFAEQLIAEIHQKTKSPITRVIVTHPNPDKFNALSAFHKVGAESVASAKTASAMADTDAYKRHFWVKIAKTLTDDTYPKLEAVKTTFSGQKKIRLKSGEMISLIELKAPGISSTQTVVRFDKTGDLAVGDLVHYQSHAWLEGGIVNGKAVPTLAGWKADLKQLLTLAKGAKGQPGIVYGGRGEFAAAAVVVPAQIAYLDKADAVVSDYIQGLADKVGELSDPARQPAHYATIQATLVKAFPGYAYPDLVGYSVYGLVQQKLSALPK